MKKIILYILLLTGTQVFSQKIDYDNFDTSLYVNECVNELNKFRKSRGLGKVTLDSNAYKLSMSHGKYMLNMKDVNHDLFIERQIKYDYNADGENCLSLGLQRKSCEEGYTYQELAKSTIKRWIESNSHMWNMLRRNSINCGIGFGVSDNRVPGGVRPDPTTWAYKEFVYKTFYVCLVVGDGTERKSGFYKTNTHK